MTLANHLKPIAISLLGLGLLAVAAAIGLSDGGAADPAHTPPVPAASSPVSVVNGVTMVRLDLATQHRSGVATEALTATTRRVEVTVFGNVLDLQPLIDLRSRHDAAQADAVAAQAAAAVSRAEVERNRALYEDQRNVSLKAYQAAQAADLANQAKADAAGRSVRNIEASAQQQFGNTLARWAFDSGSAAFSRLLKRTDVLVRVTLPPASGTHAPPTEIDVQASGGSRIPGFRVSAAAQADPGVAGTSWVYQVASPLAVGASVVGYLPTTIPAAQAVFVPPSAVVWYAGQPWAYVQDSPTRFARQALGQSAQAGGGYIAVADLQPGQRIVTSGAGLLLSEEQRPPPGGAGCKDPECD